MTNPKARTPLSPPKRVRTKYTVSLPASELCLGERTFIMGIVNVTPDSFSKDGTLTTKKNPVSQAMRMIKDGADIIDIGGESSRPGAKTISVKEELTRVIPAVKELKKKTDIPVSVDTYKPEVARAALDAGASIVNNIMGSKPDKALLKQIREYKAAVVLMHIQGTPRNMQKNPEYFQIIAEISENLKKSAEICLENGINSDKIILDPGIGFGKTADHNLKIINRLNEFKTLRKPLLLGTSRKSFIGKVLNSEVEGRVMGTMATVTAGILKGAHIVRVHDVREVKKTALMADAIINERIN